MLLKKKEIRKVISVHCSSTGQLIGCMEGGQFDALLWESDVWCSEWDRDPLHAKSCKYNLLLQPFLRWSISLHWNGVCKWLAKCFESKSFNSFKCRIKCQFHAFALGWKLISFILYFQKLQVIHTCSYCLCHWLWENVFS